MGGPPLVAGERGEEGASTRRVPVPGRSAVTFGTFGPMGGKARS